MKPDYAELLKSGLILTLKQADILACPHCIMMPEHYFSDGRCKCREPGHTIMAEWGYTWDATLAQWISPGEDD